MKLKNSLLGMSALAIMGAMSTSCTNEMVTPYPDQNGNSNSMLVHTPDFYAWSGDQWFGNTRSGDVRTYENGTDANGYFTFETVTEQWEDSYSRYGAKGPYNIFAILRWGIDDSWFDLTNRDWLKEEWITSKDNDGVHGSVKIPPYYPEGTAGDAAIAKLITDFGIKLKAGQSYTFYPYLSGATDQNHKQIGLFYYDSEGVKHEQIVWDADIDKYDQFNGTIKGVTIKADKDCVLGMYFSGRKHGSSTNDTYYYSLPELNQLEPFIDTDNMTPNSESTRIHCGFIPTEYLGIYNGSVLMVEDWTDYDYDDFMIFFKETVETTTSDDLKDGVEPGPGENPGGGGTTDPTPDPTDPDDPDEDDTCPKCPHEKHDGPCDQCEEGTTCHPNQTDPEQPGTGGGGSTIPEKEIYLHNDEVEVNFSINDTHENYGDSDLWTKLSIHVRKGTDVKIHVPLPGRYFCESDDFAILQDHANGIYTGMGQGSESSTLDHNILPYHHQMTYTIQGTDQTWTVTLKLTITDNGMDVETRGITQDLIDYLFEQNGDGINFEIWNYFQDTTLDNVDGKINVSGKLEEDDILAFQEILNQSTIDFLGEAPSFYINAFGYNWKDGKIYTTDIRPHDCTVTPLSSTFEMFPNFCYHLNGTPWNVIWIYKDVDKKSEGYEHHTVTPKPAVPVNLYNEHYAKHLDIGKRSLISSSFFIY